MESPLSSKGSGAAVYKKLRLVFKSNKNNTTVPGWISPPLSSSKDNTGLIDDAQLCRELNILAPNICEQTLPFSSCCCMTYLHKWNIDTEHVEHLHSGRFVLCRCKVTPW